MTPEQPLQPVDRALDVALLVLRSGGTTAMADRAFRDILAGHGVQGVSAAWRLDFVAAGSQTDGRYPMVLRPVGPVGVNLTRVLEAARLAELVAAGQVPTTAIAAEVERINGLAPAYNRWILVAFAAGSGAFFSQIPGGDWGALGIAAVAAGTGQMLRQVLQARNLAVAAVTLLSGLLSACIAAAGLRLGLSRTEAPALVAAVIYMVPGLPLINGFVDMISHRYLFVGLERIANAIFLFVVLAIAIAFAITIVT